MLQKSEICQRFFFGMGKEWIFNLTDFFKTELETYVSVRNSLNYDALGSDSRNGTGDSDGDRDGDGDGWFYDTCRVHCAVLALQAIAGALETTNQKHQKLVAMQTNVAPSAAFWIARKGPSELVDAALLLLTYLVQDNADVAAHVAESMIEINPNISGKSYPKGVEVPAVYFGWRPLPSDDRRFITIPALLAERYIFSSTSWNVPSSSSSSSTARNSSPDCLSVQCLNVLETLLKAGPTTCDIMVQYVLAPPPPSGDDDGQGGITALEAMRYVRYTIYVYVQFVHYMLHYALSIIIFLDRYSNCVTSFILTFDSASYDDEWQ